MILPCTLGGGWSQPAGDWTLPEGWEWNTQLLAILCSLCVSILNYTYRTSKFWIPTDSVSWYKQTIELSFKYAKYLFFAYMQCNAGCPASCLTIGNNSPSLFAWNRVSMYSMKCISEVQWLFVCWIFFIRKIEILFMIWRDIYIIIDMHEFSPSAKASFC